MENTDSITCPFCRTPVPHAPFCRQCGAPLPSDTDALRMYLDGTPVIDSPEAVVDPADLPVPPAAFRPDEPPRIEFGPPAYGPATARGFWGKILWLVADPEIFFFQLVMEYELPSASLLLFIVLLINTIPIGIMVSFDRFLKPLTNLYQLALFPFASFGFLLIVSFIGKFVIYSIGKEIVDWRQLFSIYAFSSWPLVPVWIPIVILTYESPAAFWGLLFMFSFPWFIASVRLCAIGFENVFGFEPFAATSYAIGLPLFTAALLLSLIAWFL